MIEGRRRAGFAKETLEVCPRSSLIRRSETKGGLSLQLNVFRKVNLTHAARPERRDNSVL